MVIERKLSTGFIHRCAKPVGIAQNYARYLTRLLASQLAGEPLRRKARGRCLVLVGVLCVMGITPAKGVTNTDYLKLYLHTKIIDYKGFHCAVSIAQIESHWNPSAQNGNHYGLFQMNNKKVRYMNPFGQIDWWHRYLMTRYKGDACAALLHLKTKGWQ